MKLKVHGLSEPDRNELESQLCEPTEKPQERFLEPQFPYLQKGTNKYLLFLSG